MEPSQGGREEAGLKLLKALTRMPNCQASALATGDRKNGEMGAKWGETEGKWG
eukprot:CAMPEP_0174372404 /NCGR_PEP_ID=MMETSP0811_2-20130205/103491_1 /TAXON_ID=73025 ORGANISM="Eutreptiella gymnastica-like, Strain CCMP1594" /NCGR_SAMPLE_ID=MMETSP0811_2 /ASSEMBLY_ACC=CAM_ASM_000667 /LENGTH=52 /DNA_ID=CAMNT_0015519807 /DNA_START=134 /DNA_END=288 /DNA_ORIENTATION=-